MTLPAAAASDGEVPSESGRRVDWFELFFDLVFVAFIIQLAHVLHGAPGPEAFLVFVAWSVPAWWAWSNVMVCVNLLPPLSERLLRATLLVSMGFVGLMAASVTDDAQRAWAFSLGCAGLRLVLLWLWLHRAGRTHRPLGRVFLYNGATAVVWVASALFPSPVNFALWAAAILTEVLLLRLGNLSTSRSLQVDPWHASERLGLFMIILMGESVLSVVTTLGQHWTGGSALAALLGLVTICALASGFFVFGTATMEEGLVRLSLSRDLGGLLDTVMLLPYLLVVGVTMLAAGLATAVAAPDVPLPVGAGICLGGGVALFYLTNTIVSVRWGARWKALLRWAVPGVPLPLLLVLLAPHVASIVSLGLLTAIVVGVVAGSAAAHRRRHPAPAG